MKHIDETLLAELKAKLEAEQIELQTSLSDQGRIIDGENDWAAVPPTPDESEHDHTVQADQLEEFFTRGASLATLEERLVEVQSALARMNDGTYGMSTTSGEPIETERLLANPAATNTIAEMKANQ